MTSSVPVTILFFHVSKAEFQTNLCHSDFTLNVANFKTRTPVNKNYFFKMPSFELFKKDKV